ncbi:hypothetical protein SDD30_03250 [Moorella naiadis]|uniref:hypothetical protein n=1 Tax=Moorella naiadis (nom. illeg.) TaxID=3093670 RepID=UPI003D9C895C
MDVVELNLRWDIIKKIPRLRRVFVSPWAISKIWQKKLQDEYIFSMKPHPGVLAEFNIDEDKIRKDLRHALEITRNFRVEIIMKDNHTLGNNPQNVI